MGDIIGGITLACLMVGEGIAYALLGGLAPTAGLYAAVIPVLIYSFFGTSRHLSVGPVSLSGVMTAVLIESVGTGVASEDAHLGSALALVTGILLVIFSLARMGFLEYVLSKPIIEGFVTGLACTVISGQLPTLVGINKKDFPHFHGHTAWENLGFFFGHLGYARRHDVGMALSCLVIMFSIKVLKKRDRFWYLKYTPGVLVCTLFANIVSKVAMLEANHQVRVLGVIPSGFPKPAMPSISFELFLEVVPAAVIVAFVGWVESMSVARQMSLQHHYEVSGNREMLALGMANIWGSFFSAMVVAGSIGRTHAANGAGTKSHFSGFLASFLMLGACYSTALFYHMPKSSVAAIIVFCISALIEIWALPDMKRQKQNGDLFFFMLAFFLTFAMGIEEGIILSALISTVYVIRKGTIPTPIFLGRVPGTEIYKPLAPTSDARPVPNMMIIQPGTSLFYYVNAAHFQLCVNPFLNRSIRADLPDWLAEGECDGIILDFANVEVIDFTAMEVMVDMVKIAMLNGVGLGISGLRKDLLTAVRASHVVHYVNKAYIGVTVADVARAMQKSMGVGGGAEERNLDDEDQKPKNPDEDSDLTRPSSSEDESD